MDATALVETQHAELLRLFDRAAEHEVPSARWALFERIADQLAMHLSIEEQLFYPAIAVGELDRWLLSADDDHRSIRTLLGQLVDLDPSVPRFDALLAILEDEVRRHVAFEEREILPRARTTFSGDELEQLGAEMGALYEELVGGTAHGPLAAEPSGPAGPP